ncbi:MAG: PKD domain-containing protein [Flavobacteriales bacterium]|nr:PKD domain-containing protein [Flavobacteriales bacterium]
MKERSALGVRKALLLLGTALLVVSAKGQCPQLYDYYGVPSSTPTWFSCTGNNFSLLIATPNAVGDFTIDWGDGSPLYAGASLVPPQTVSHVYASNVAEYTVTFTELSSGCVVSGTLTMEESSSASIQIPIGGLTQVCAPEAVEFINSSTNVSPNTVFTWDFGDNSPILTFDHTNWGQTISHTYQQGTVDCETTVRLTAENSCNDLQGGPSFATFNPIRIWDLDDATIAPSATLLCWPDRTVTFANTTDRNCFQQGNIFQRYEYWNFGDYWGTGQDSIIDWTPWPPTFPRTIAYPAIGSYEVMLLDSNYCGIDTAYVTINIVPPPSVTLTANPTPVCAGTQVNFNETTTGGANYFQWDFGTGNGFGWTGAGDQAFTYNTAGSYSVRYTASVQGASAGCADTATVVVEVLPSPTALFDVDNDAACDQLTVAFTNNSVNGVTYLWDFGDGTTSGLQDPPPHDYTSFGSYTITLTVTNSQNCQDVATRVVNVYEPPQVQIGAQNVCEGVLSSFADLTVTEPGNPITSWAWDFGDGGTDTVQSPDHQYAASGNYTVTLTSTTPYCSGAGTLPVVVEAKPVADFVPSVSIGCSPMTVDFTNTSVGGVDAIWTFGDGGASNDDSPSHTFLNLGTQDSVYTVQLIVSTAFGCSDTIAMPITVAPGVQALFVHNGMPGCAPLAVDFTNNSTGAQTYLWDFGDGTTSPATNTSHTYVNTSYVLQTRTVRLIAYSNAGCTDTMTQQVLVYPTPDFTFVATPDSGCSPHTVTFPSVVGAVSYAWDFGDGSNGAGPSPTHIYFNDTDADIVYPVTLIGSNAFGCVDTTYDEVTVYPVPAAQLLVAPLTGCHPLTATLTDLSTGATGLEWDYGDGTTGDTSVLSHTHTWFNYAGSTPVTYPISLTATNDHGCTGTATAQVQVFPAVTAAFVSDSIGCAPLAADLTNVSTGATSYQWSFGDGQTSGLGSPSHTYTNQGLDDVVMDVLLTATSAFGCSDTASTQITVHPQPIAQFAPDVQTGCQPLSVDFQDLSIGATTLAWDFGDGITQSTGLGNVAHTYSNTSALPLFFDPSLIATSIHGCTDTTSSQIQIYPEVIASFAVDSVGCSPVTVTIANTSTGAASYLWDMGDGTTLVGVSPTHTYVNNSASPQLRTITLTATSAFGCSSTTTRTITVHPVPVAAFQATPFTQQFPNATVNLMNNSSPGPWGHTWTFGDGTQAVGQSPGSHTYGTWGSYTITLVVSGGVCSDTAVQVVEITPPLPTASFLGQGVGCAPLTVEFTNTSFGGQSYSWSFGDGGMSTADNPTYIYNVPGVYTVTLTATGIGGGVNTMTKVDSVVVHPRATAFFVLQPEEVTVPSQPVFTYNLSGNATQYQWDFGDGNTSSEMNPVHYYQQAGEFDVQLISNNAWNCPDTFMLPSAVTALAAGDLQFPNAFTPGNSGPTDGVYDPRSFDNDFFYPLYQGVEDYKLEIFNRWGELMFVSEDVKVGWDGYYRGQPAKQDVYVWKAYAKFSDGEETVLKGDVTLLR